MDRAGWTFGEEEGLTAGRGNAGDGDALRLKAEIVDCAGDPEIDDLRLVENVGGFIGIDMDVGVPGHDEVGDSAVVSSV
jgi:hypothetical protein